MTDARRYAIWPEPRSRSRSLKGSRPSVPHGTNFFNAKICPSFFDLYTSICGKCLRGVLVIIREICMRLNGWLTLSAVVVVRVRHQLLSWSSAVVLVVHRRQTSVCQKSAPPHITSYICRFPPQNFSAIYLLQHSHICTSAFYHCPYSLWSPELSGLLQNVTVIKVHVPCLLKNYILLCPWQMRMSPVNRDITWY